MTLVNIGINGFGRIGRLVLRASLETHYKNLKVEVKSKRLTLTSYS